MPQADDLFDADFDAQLQGLFQQAERAIHHPGESPKSPETTPKVETILPATHENVLPPPQPAPTSPAVPPPVPGAETPVGAPSPGYLKPLIQGMEAVLRAATENTALIKRLEATEQTRLDSLEAQQGLPKLVADLRAIVETRSSVSQSMFSALHQELKGYKDGFLLQTVHRPIIRDLVTVYDDIAELHRQIDEMIGDGGGEHGKKAQQALFERLRQFRTNLANNLDFILEVLARLEVSPMLPGTDKLDKLTQRAVSLEPAETAEEDGSIVRSVKRGFMWKDAVLRPEEVVIKKWKRSGSGEEPPAGK